MKRFISSATLTACLLLFVAGYALAATVTIAPIDAKTYSVLGTGMDGVAGIDLTIGYDSSSLSTPSVTQGTQVSGALMAANTGSAGSIKIAIISTKPFSGNGQIATISFANQQGAGGITSFNGSLINVQGGPVSASFTMAGGPDTTVPGLSNTAGVPFSQPSSPATPPASPITPPITPPPAATSATPTYLGTVTMPTDGQTSGSSKPVEPAGVPAVPAAPVPKTEQPSLKTEEPAAASADSVPKAQEIKTTNYPAILDRFRSYQGEKNPAIMMALFSKPVAQLLRQEPPIVISDGNTPVKLYAELSSGAQATSPNFAFNGARMISLKRDDESGKWIIELMPQANILKATVTILDNGSIIEYPLTLVPPAAISPLEADFTAFLRDSGVAKPKFDLNKDGRHDSVDDYIYTGHYLLLKSKKTAPNAP